jgi:hypothetical protein
MVLDPPAHGIVTAGEEPGVVSVEALDATRRPPYATVRSRSGPIARKCGVAFGGIASVAGA